MKPIKFLVINNNIAAERRASIQVIKSRLEKEFEDLGITITESIQEGLELYKDSSDWAILVINIEHELLQEIGSLITMLRQAHTSQIVAITVDMKLEDQLRVYECGVDICFNHSNVLDADIECAFFTNYYRRYKAFMACFTQHMDELTKALQSVKKDTLLCFKDELEIDQNKRVVKIDGKVIDLTAKEYDLLHYLAVNANIVQSYAAIMQNVFLSDYIFSSDLSSRITRLRQKIERNSKIPTYIKNVRQVGYIFVSE